MNTTTRKELKKKKNKLLETKGLTKKFYGLTAVDNLNINIYENELVGLIGPNGSGKTTLFNCIMGMLHYSSGKIVFNGEDITNRKPYKIALKGITRTFQLVQCFPKMTVMENMMIGIQQFQGERILSSILNTKSVRKLEKKNEEKALDLLNFLEIIDLKNEIAMNLSYGQKKLLEIGIALMPTPKLMLLDEPASGVNPTLIRKIEKKLKKLNENGLTIFLIEHDLKFVMNLCERVIVLNYGEKIAEGNPDHVKNNPEVIDAYFGG
jgi:branched-chain amino acid transport system ATP-binding protein/neutral amino acid transport system ATP-binding protein